MKRIVAVIGSGVLFLLSGCDNSSIDTSKITEISNELNESASQFENGALRVTKAFENGYRHLDKTLLQTNIVADQVDQRMKSSRIHLDKNIKLLDEKLEKVQSTFIATNEKLIKLEKLYISEGTVELAGVNGKINLERFPATAQTKCVFMEDAYLKSNSYTGRAQSNGIWVINGKSYDLKEKMTFRYRAYPSRRKTSTRDTSLTSVTFTNTHGEIVTTTQISGYILSMDLKKSVIKLDTREVDGRQNSYIAKNKECFIVLDRPLNLNIRE